VKRRGRRAAALASKTRLASACRPSAAVSQRRQSKTRSQTRDITYRRRERSSARSRARSTERVWERSSRCCETYRSRQPLRRPSGRTATRAKDHLLQVSAIGLQNAHAVFGGKRRLKGVGTDGGGRQAPILELSIRGASEQRAARNIRRIVVRFIAQRFGYGEGRVKAGWLTRSRSPLTGSLKR
jgi:hypothetical protein